MSFTSEGISVKGKNSMQRIFSSANIRLTLEVVLLTAALVFILSRSTPTEAAPTVMEPAAPASTSWHTCNSPDQVAVFTNRVHVHCASTTPAISGVSWFAVPTAPDSAAASRFMSVIQTAMIAGRPLLLWVDPADLSGGSFGCGTGDCRRLYGVEMQ